MESSINKFTSKIKQLCAEENLIKSSKRAKNALKEKAENSKATQQAEGESVYNAMHIPNNNQGQTGHFT